MKINNIIVAPILTEKPTGLANNNIYMFEINPKSNKFQVKEALEKLYKVKVGEVKVSIRKGKTRRYGRRMKAKKLADRKLAYIKLKEGKLDLFPKT